MTSPGVSVGDLTDAAPTTNQGGAGRRSISVTLRSLPLGLSAAFIGFALLVKVYAVSHYSLTTTTALASAAPGLVFLGTLASYAYVLVGAAAFSCLHLWIRSGNFSLGVAWSISLLTFFFTLSLLTPWFYWWQLGIGFLLLTAFTYVRDVVQRPPAVPKTRHPERLQGARLLLSLLARGRRAVDSWLRLRGRRTRVAANLAFLGASVALLVRALLPSLDQPWLPAEVITFSQAEVTAEHPPNKETPSRSAVVEGYVFSSDDQWTQILEATHRFVMRVPTDHITARRVCRFDANILNARPTLLQSLQQDPYTSPNRACRTVLKSVREEAAALRSDARR